MAIALRAGRLGRLRSPIDWHDEAPHRGRDRMDWLRAEAAAMIGEAREIEIKLGDASSHECVTCEWCRLAIIATAERMKYV